VRAQGARNGAGRRPRPRGGGGGGGAAGAGGGGGGGPWFLFFFFFPSPVAFFHQLEILGLFPTPSPQEEINLGHHFLHHYPGRRETSFLPTNTPCRMDGWIMMMVGMSGTAEKHFFHCIPYHG